MMYAIYVKHSSSIEVYLFIIEGIQQRHFSELMNSIVTEPPESYNSTDYGGKERERE